MKAFARFFHNSTGYVIGSNPPYFSPEHVRPIELLGSDGIRILDARNNLDTMINDCYKHIDSMNALNKGIVGFEVHIGNLHHSRVIYTNIITKNKLPWK